MNIHRAGVAAHGGHIDLRIATYNVHRCRGLDRRVNPSRMAAVLADIDADVIALQEVMGSNASNPGHAEELGAALGMGWVMAPARRLRGHLFGNVMLSRLPIREHSQFDLSWNGREPRCCQRVDLAVSDHTVHLYNAPSARRCASVVIRRFGWPRSSTIAGSRGRRWCSAISTSGRAAWRRRC